MRLFLWQRRGGGGQQAGPLPRLALAAAVSACLPGGAEAADAGAGAASAGLLWQLLVAALALLVAYGYWRRKQIHQDADALREELSRLQAELDRTELLLLAEPQILMLWENPPSAADDDDSQPGDQPEFPLPDGNDLEIFVHPQLKQEVLEEDTAANDFHAWLEDDAVRRLRQLLRTLREEGSPFNVSLRTRSGMLIEADGRVTGRYLMLRFRPLHGERLEMLTRAHDQQQLKEQAQRLTRLLATAPLPVWMSGENGRLQWANEEWLKLMGAPSLEAAKAEGMMLPGRAERAAATMLPDEGEWQRYVAATVIKGERRHFEIRERPFDRGTVHWAQEVSDRVALEEELERRTAAQNRIFDQLSTALAIFDADRRLVFHNTAYARLWELDEAWLAQHPTEEEILNRLYDAGKLSLMEDFPQWRQRWLDNYHRQTTQRERWQLAGGQVVQVIAEPQAGEGVIMMFEDITEQMRLEARYREALQVQEETLDNLHEAVAVFGTDGRLKLFNHTFAALWNLDEARLRVHPHIDDIISDCQAQVSDSGFWEEIKYIVTGLGEERKPVGGRMTHANGHIFDHLAMPLPDGNTLITWYDMTDAVRAEQALRERAAALEESDRAKAAFLDSISYDLRTPLTTINGYTEMLETGYAGALAPLQQQYLQHVRAASNELLEKIDTILDLAAIDTGKMSLDVTRFEVLPLLRELADGIAMRLEQRDMELEIELAEDAREMEGDRARIMQALRHLLLNAIGFGHKGQVVRMGAGHDENGNMTFWVADSGPGMTTEMMQRAFERFFARPSPEGHRGPGLGLPLVKAIMELHGGRVELHSQEGHGTTVICKLPQRQLAEQPA